LKHKKVKISKKKNCEEAVQTKKKVDNDRFRKIKTKGVFFSQRSWLQKYDDVFKMLCNVLIWRAFI